MFNDTSKTYPQPHCPNCGSSLRLVVEKNDWYCDTCQTFPKNSAEISKKRIMGTKEGSKKFWIYMTIVMLAVFGWFIFEGITERDPFLKSFFRQVPRLRFHCFVFLNYLCGSLPVNSHKNLNTFSRKMLFRLILSREH